MNVNVLLVVCLFVLIKAESMLESNPLDNISELKPEAKETRNLDCCSAAMDSLATNISNELTILYNTFWKEVTKMHDGVDTYIYRLDKVQDSLGEIDERRRDKFQLRDHTLDLVENSLKDMDQRRRVLIEAESMFQSSPLEDIIELKPETKETQDLECCLATEIDVSDAMVHNVRVVSAAIDVDLTQINEVIRLYDFRIGEIQKQIKFLDGQIRGK